MSVNLDTLRAELERLDESDRAVLSRAWRRRALDTLVEMLGDAASDDAARLGATADEDVTAALRAIRLEALQSSWADVVGERLVRLQMAMKGVAYLSAVLDARAENPAMSMAVAAVDMVGLRQAALRGEGERQTEGPETEAEWNRLLREARDLAR